MRLNSKWVEILFPDFISERKKMHFDLLSLLVWNIIFHIQNCNF